MSRKFKIGDRVKIISGAIGANTLAMVEDIDESPYFPYCCRFIEGQGHGYVRSWFNEDELELVNEEKL